MTLYANAEGHHRPGGKELRHHCHRLYPQTRFYRYSERRYRIRDTLTRGQKHYILRMARCQHSVKKQRWALKKRRLFIHRRYHRVYRLCRSAACNARLALWYGGTCARTLVFRESGFNEQARNTSSGAYGLPQALPGWKMASYGSDWAWNPVTQLRWMRAYVYGRYGGWCAALAHSYSAGWY